MISSDPLGGTSLLTLLAVVSEPVREIVEGCEEKVGRDGCVTEGVGALG